MQEKQCSEVKHGPDLQRDRFFRTQLWKQIRRKQSNVSWVFSFRMRKSHIELGLEGVGDDDDSIFHLRKMNMHKLVIR
ncbi:hypothetical protein Tco_1258366 [Tanacetum coccineum]